MSNAFRTLDQADVAGKRVLVRVDLNVPMENGKVTDVTRIERVAPTIREIADKGGKVILLAHFGRPKGRDPKESLKPVAATVGACHQPAGRLRRRLRRRGAEKAVAAMKDGDILLLENTRFHKDEEKNDPAFVAKLAKLGDIYVNDAFSAAHRAHASTEASPASSRPMRAAPCRPSSRRCQGARTPKRPVIAIVGGAKVSTKLELLENLIAKVEALVIGGAMANTFLLAQGIKVGKSLAEKDMADTARRIMDKAEDANCAIILPIDAMVAYHFEANAPAHAYGLDAIPPTA